MKRQLRAEPSGHDTDLKSRSSLIDRCIGNTWVQPGIVIAVVFFLFLPIRRFEYSLVDDLNNVYSNRFLANIHAQNIGYFWTHAYYELYMPVTDTIWALLARIAPLKTPLVVIPGNGSTIVNPAVFHCASIGFHLATTVLVFGILRALRLKPWSCATGALIFGTHPLQVQSVAWITGMNNLTCGFFGFLAVYIYLLQAGNHEQEPGSSRNRVTFLLLSTVAFALALLSKPMATTIPLFVAVLELFALRRRLQVWIKPVSVWVLLSLACIVATHFASVGADYDRLSPAWARPFVAADALCFYIVKLFFPYELTFDYGRNPPFILAHWWGYASGVFLLLVMALAGARLVLTKRKNNPIDLKSSTDRRFGFVRENEGLFAIALAGFLIFCAGLLPTLGLVPYYSEAISTVNDRYAYLAMLGPAMIAGTVLSANYGSTRARSLVSWLSAIAVVSCICLTALQLPIWANRYSFTNDMLLTSPNSAMAHQSYGIILGGQGKWSDALDEFTKAERLQLAPGAAVDDAIGQSLYHLKRYDESIAHYKTAIRIEPDDNDAWFQLWLIYSRLNRLKEAEAFDRERIATYPDDERAKFTLGLVLMQENRPSDALPYIELAAATDPDSSDDQFYVGVIYQKLGRFQDAEARYKRALELNPDNTDAAKGLVSLPRGIQSP